VLVSVTVDFIGMEDHVLVVQDFVTHVLELVMEIVLLVTEMLSYLQVLVLVMLDGTSMELFVMLVTTNVILVMEEVTINAQDAKLMQLSTVVHAFVMQEAIWMLMVTAKLVLVVVILVVDQMLIL
jgi:hypothetical protein